MCQQNHEASRMQCEEVLREVFDKMEKSISNGSYLKPGGYQQYRDTLRHLSNDYSTRTHSQIMVQFNMHALLTFNCSGSSQQHLAALINIFHSDVVTVMKLKHENIYSLPGLQICLLLMFSLKHKTKNSEECTCYFLSKQQFVMIRDVKLETLKKKHHE